MKLTLSLFINTIMATMVVSQHHFYCGSQTCYYENRKNGEYGCRWCSCPRLRTSTSEKQQMSLNTSQTIRLGEERVLRTCYEPQCIYYSSISDYSDCRNCECP